MNRTLLNITCIIGIMFLIIEMIFFDILRWFNHVQLFLIGIALIFLWDYWELEKVERIRKSVSPSK